MTQSHPHEAELHQALLKVRKIVSHENCADGIAAAFLLHLALPGAEVQFVQYKEPSLEQLPAEPHMLFCDMSPPRERVQEFLDVDSIVLDHHKGAEDVVKQFRLHVFADEATMPGVSGATLAYREVLTRVAPYERAYALEDLANLAGIRDTWQTKNPDWADASAVSAALKFYGYARLLKLRPALTPTFEGWDGFLMNLQRLGSTLIEKNQEGAVAVLKEGYRYTSKKGTRVVVFNALGPTSDAAEVDDGKEFDLVVGFKSRLSGDAMKVAFTMRSHTTFDCKALALLMKGGGHTKAAGFSVPVIFEASPYKQFVDLLEYFELEQTLP
jgi:nanoRNase/pAp phosphatase (c-di-AMP/oligoRNAs hydrolase)